jgi:hypothetical protein
MPRHRAQKLLALCLAYAYMRLILRLADPEVG